MHLLQMLFIHCFALGSPWHTLASTNSCFHPTGQDTAYKKSCRLPLIMLKDLDSF